MLILKTLIFFDHIQKLWERLQQQLERRRYYKFRERREQKRMRDAVEAIVEGTDTRLRSVRNYQKQLCECACNLLDHLESLVDSMPPPLVVDSKSLFSDPLVHTLLSDMQTVQRLLIRNQDIQEYFDSVDNAIRDEVFALLFIRHSEKTILGSEIRGEIILREVKQTAYSFYGHRLVGPSPTEEDARFEMLLTLFESVVRFIKDQFLQEKKDLINQKDNYAAIHPDENINNPEVYIKKLVKQLSFPTQLIRLQDNLVRISKMGIKLPLDSPVSSNLLRLYELRVGEAESCVVTIIRYPRDGMLDRNLSRAISF